MEQIIQKFLEGFEATVSKRYVHSEFLEAYFSGVKANEVYRITAIIANDDYGFQFMYRGEELFLSLKGKSIDEALEIISKMMHFTETKFVISMSGEIMTLENLSSILREGR